MLERRKKVDNIVLKGSGDALKGIIMRAIGIRKL